MTSAHVSDKVNYRLLGLLSDLVICSRCLCEGVVTPVPQVFSTRHTPRALCQRCLESRRRPAPSGKVRRLARR